MTRGVAAAAALVLGLLASGCTYVAIEQGTPLRPEDARRVVRGDAKAEVLETLGAPTAMGHFPGGSWFEYRFRVTDTDQVDVSFLQASGSWASTEVRSDRLLVRFDRTGRVLDIGVPSGIGLDR